MANIGSTTISNKEWNDLEEVITDLELTVDTAYTLSVEGGKGYICNSASEPSKSIDGFPICNEKFGYQHASGKLYVKNTDAKGLMINIAE